MIILVGGGYLIIQELLNILNASTELLVSFNLDISNQPVAGSIIVLQDSSRVYSVHMVALYGSILSTWTVFHGVTPCKTSFTGTLL